MRVEQFIILTRIKNYQNLVILSKFGIFAKNLFFVMLMDAEHPLDLSTRV